MSIRSNPILSRAAGSSFENLGTNGESKVTIRTSLPLASPEDSIFLINDMEGYHLNRYLSQEQIASIVQRLADQISKDYTGRELVLVCILKGAFMFLSDLVRRLKIPAQIDFVRLASYGAGMESSGIIEITKDIEIPIEGKDVLIIEDIIDSGRTLQFLKDRLFLANPRSVKICALLDKKARREVEMEADYLGSDVDNVFIVGYGIDFDENYRHLPEIYYVTTNEPQKS